MDSVNLKKLSGILGLSMSTISKALRDSHEISSSTKERVVKAAKEFNYQPNIYASSLRKSKSKTIAVIVPEFANNFFVSAIDGVHKVAQSKGYHVLIYLTHDVFTYEQELVNSLSNGRVDGVLISLSRTTKELSHINRLVEKKIPVVFFDRVNTSVNCSSIITNDYESAYVATSHLIKAGCKKIAHCTISNSLSIGVKRFEGYRDALKDAKITMSPSYIIQCTDEYEKDYILIKRLLKGKHRPDALFTAIEPYALIAYEICKELSIKIPASLKVITFSNLRTAELLNPAISTITQPALEMGEAAASELIKAIEKPKYFTPSIITLKSKLFARESTK